MTQRVGLLALLLTMALHSATVAQSPPPSSMLSTPPEAAPLFAPDDVAATLPSAIGGLGLQVFEVDMDDVGPLGDEALASWRSLLLSFGKGPEAVRAAAGMVVPTSGLQPDDLPLSIYALRIDGVPADAWAKSFVDGALAFLGPESQDYLSGWRVIDGRDVYATVLTPEAIAELREVGANVPDDTGFWAYPVGEVLFWIGMPFEWPDGAPTVEDVLAEPPFTSPSPEPTPSPGPVGVGLRVELPQYGFALTFPDDWDVVSESPLVARGQEEKCAVMVSPADLPLETIAADHVAWFDGQPNRFPGGATATDVALPAGQAKRIDVRHPEEGWPMLNTSVYLLTHGSRGYSLSCTRKDAPEDRWLSIATTFEFLPAAE